MPKLTQRMAAVASRDAAITERRTVRESPREIPDPDDFLDDMEEGEDYEFSEEAEYYEDGCDCRPGINAKNLILLLLGDAFVFWCIGACYAGGR